MFRWVVGLVLIAVGWAGWSGWSHSSAAVPDVTLPTALDLGTHYESFSDSGTLFVRNNGAEAVTLAVTTVGPLEHYGCADPVAPGMLCQLNIRANVATAGAYSGEVAVAANGVAVGTVSVTGRSIRAALLVDWDRADDLPSTHSLESFRDPENDPIRVSGERQRVAVRGPGAMFNIESAEGLRVGVYSGDQHTGTGTQTLVSGGARSCTGRSEATIHAIEFDGDGTLLLFDATATKWCDHSEDVFRAEVRIGTERPLNTVEVLTRGIDTTVVVGRPETTIEVPLANRTAEPQRLSLVRFVAEAGQSFNPIEVVADVGTCPLIMPPGSSCAIALTVGANDSVQMPSGFHHVGRVEIRPASGRPTFLHARIIGAWPRVDVRYVTDGHREFTPSGYFTRWFDVELTGATSTPAAVVDFRVEDDRAAVFYAPDCIGVELALGERCRFRLTYMGTSTPVSTTLVTAVDQFGVEVAWFAGPTVGSGYALARSNGDVWIHGGVDGQSSFALLEGEELAGVAFTADAGGVWGVTASGRVLTVGTARHLGDVAELQLNAPVLSIVPTQTGAGYWLLARDGGVFSFGDALFHGSTGAMVLNKPVVDMAPTATGEGYWLVAEDGGVFAFGDAEFLGSTGHLILNQPVVGMDATADGGGYWMVAVDGGIFAFGNAPFHGSLGDRVLPDDVVDMAVTPTGEGYWIGTSGGDVHIFSDASAEGSPGYAGFEDFVSMASMTAYSAGRAQLADRHRDILTVLDGQLVFVAGDVG